MGRRTEFRLICAEDPVTPGHPPGAPRERCPVRIELFSGGGKATEEWYMTVP